MVAGRRAAAAPRNHHSDHERIAMKKIMIVHGRKDWSKLLGGRYPARHPRRPPAVRPDIMMASAKPPQQHDRGTNVYMMPMSLWSTEVIPLARGKGHVTLERHPRKDQHDDQDHSADAPMMIGWSKGNRVQFSCQVDSFFALNDGGFAAHRVVGLHFGHRMLSNKRARPQV